MPFIAKWHRDAFFRWASLLLSLVQILPSSPVVCQHSLPEFAPTAKAPPTELLLVQVSACRGQLLRLGFLPGVRTGRAGQPVRTKSFSSVSRYWVSRRLEECSPSYPGQ